jgi:hypothetical protein
LAKWPFALKNIILKSQRRLCRGETRPLRMKLASNGELCRIGLKLHSPGR